MIDKAYLAALEKVKDLEGQLEMQQEAWRDLNREFSGVIEQRDALAEALRVMLEASDGLAVGQSNRDKARTALKQLEEE